MRRLRFLLSSLPWGACSAIAVLVCAANLPLTTRFLLPLFSTQFLLSEGRVRFRAFASIPGRVYACRGSPGSSTRLSAVIHLCEGPWPSRAARGSATHRRATSDGWAASELKLRARGRVRGSHGGFLFHQVAQESPRLSRAAQLKFVGFEK